MKTLLRKLSGSLAIAAISFLPCVLSGQSTTATVVSPASAAAADFKAVTSKLDFGGTAFWYSSYHGTVDNLYAIVEPVLQDYPQARGFGLMAKAALLKLGLNDLSMGSSVLPKADGGEVRKTYVRAVNRPGILALWGSSGQPLKATDFIPANATAAWSGRIEFAQVLPIVNNMAESAIGPAGRSMVEDLVDKANNGLAINIKDILSSLGTEYEFHYTSKTDASGKVVPVFTGRLAVKNDALYEATKKVIGNLAKVEAVADADGLKIVKLLFGSGDDAQQYLVANQPGWLVVSTTVDDIKTTEVATAERLLNSPDFSKFAPGLPAQIDGLSYVSQAYTDETMKGMLGKLELAHASSFPEDAESSSSNDIFKSVINHGPGVVEKMGFLGPYTGWRVNDPDGILFMEVGKPRHGPTPTLAATGGIVIAITVPAFLRARENARARACQEHLSIMDGAKEQYALEYKKQDGDPVSMEDIKPYLKETPKCPARGEYTLNPVGTHPVCTIGDNLPEGTPPHSLENE